MIFLKLLQQFSKPDFAELKDYFSSTCEVYFTKIVKRHNFFLPTPNFKCMRFAEETKLKRGRNSNVIRLSTCTYLCL